MLDASWDFTFAVFMISVAVRVVWIAVGDIVLYFKIKRSAKQMGLRDRGEVAEDKYKNQAVHDKCKRAVRIGIPRNSIGKAGSVRYCWQCKCQLGPDTYDSNGEVVAVDESAVEASSSVVPILDRPDLLLNHKRRLEARKRFADRNADPPTAA
jgi:hypothetical protein